MMTSQLSSDIVRCRQLTGTHRVCLNKKTIPVYRLVAKSFLPNPHKYHWIKHKDGNISNNVASNLEWVEKCNAATWS